MEADWHLKNSQMDKITLLKILPEEIWLQVFEHVTESDVLVTLFYASSFWREILSPQRTQFFFPWVLQILKKENHLQQTDCTDLLQLRLVCKMWKFGVDNMLEKRVHYENATFQGSELNKTDLAFPIYFRPFISRMRNYLDPDVLQASQDHNPFPTRHMWLCENELYGPPSIFVGWNQSDAMRNYRDNLEDFIRLCGHHFWYAQIDITPDASMTSMEWYVSLCRYVRNLPNIKFLGINFPYLSWTKRNSLMDAECFPTLEFLEFVKIDKAPKIAINRILAANRNIKALIIPTVVDPTEQHIPLELQNLQHLQILSICIPTPQDVINLSGLRNLRVLNLDFADKVQVSWQKIFETLGFNGATLTELYLKLPRVTSLQQRSNAWETSRKILKMEKLKQIHICIPNYCSLDFLLGCLSLVYLNLHFYCCETSIPQGGGRDEVTDFNKGFSQEQRFMNSNIWMLIPTLKRVDLRNNYGPVFKYRRGHAQKYVVKSEEIRPIFISYEIK